jgi:dUTP pyrophosphatase
MPPDLPVRRLRDDAVVPARAHPGDAGLDLAALDALELPPGGRAAVPTGLAVAIPEGYAGLVVPRSGLARRHGVTVANAPGLIDAGYRGELTVVLVNLGDAAHRIAPGDRIAQLVIVPVALATTIEVDELPASDGRGEGGFGSTGA